MSKSRIPIITQISWPAVAFQVAVVFTLVTLWQQKGAIIYIAVSQLSRRMICRHHFNGIQNMKHGRFAQALIDFEKSEAFFAKYPWVDKLRWVIMLSPSSMSYREMAFCNMGFASSQMGDGIKAREFYNKALLYYPQSSLANASINMLDAGKK